MSLQSADIKNHYKMNTYKQKLSSFASILSVLSIVFYCSGFLRVELEMNEQNKRINDLESVEETELLGNLIDLVTMAKIIIPGKFYQKGPLVQLVCHHGLSKTYQTSRQMLACSRPRDSRVRGDWESANVKIKREELFRVFPTI